MEYLLGLEIGTSVTKACVCECDEKNPLNDLRLVGVGQYYTTGVRKGEIFDMHQAKSAVIAAFKDAEENAGQSNGDKRMTLASALVAVSGEHVRVSLEDCPFTLPQDEIDSIVMEDCDDVVKRNGEKNPERALIHTLRRCYSLDGQDEILNPIGLHGKVLTVKTLRVTGDAHHLKDIKTTVQDAACDVEDIVFSPVAASFSALTPLQKKHGVLLIDLGGGTTNYIAYRNGILQTAGSIAVGGDHITNDIVSAFGILKGLAEELKRTEGSALVDAESTGPRITIPGDVVRAEKTINRNALHTVINARMDEIFRLVLSRIDEETAIQHLGDGVVLCGGGARLKKCRELAQNIFGCSCSLASIQNVSGLEKLENPEAFAVPLGLALYGRQDIQPAPSSFGEWVKRLLFK